MYLHVIFIWYSFCLIFTILCSVTIHQEFLVCILKRLCVFIASQADVSAGVEALDMRQTAALLTRNIKIDESGESRKNLNLGSINLGFFSAFFSFKTHTTHRLPNNNTQHKMNYMADVAQMNSLRRMREASAICANNRKAHTIVL
jgi:hypothetical protein